MNNIYCDTCAAPIERLEDGWLAWVCQDKAQDTEKSFGFSITHHTARCVLYNERALPHDVILQDLSLDYFVGAAGLASLLALLVRGADPRQLARVIARLHLPNFEDRPEYTEDDPYDYLRDVMSRWSA